MAAILGMLATLTYPSMWLPSENVNSYDAASAVAEMIATMEVCRGMIGDIFPTTRATPRDNELFCHGQILNAFDYPELAAVLDPLHFTSGGQIRIPDMRGRLPMGANYEPFENFTEYNLEVANRSGEQTVALTVNQLPAHTHTTQPHSHVDSGHMHVVPNVVFNVDLEAPGIPNPIGAAIAPPTLSGVSYAELLPETVLVDNTGSGQRHNNIPPVVGLQYVIVVR